MIERTIVGFFGATLTTGCLYILAVLGYELFQPPSKPGGSVGDAISALVALSMLLPIGFIGVCGASLVWSAIVNPPDPFDIEDEDDQDDMYDKESV